MGKAACIQIVVLLAAAWMPAAADDRPAAEKAPAAKPKLLEAIRKAPDISAAGQAYVAARNTGRKDPEVYKAYIQRLLELGEPRMAFITATELTRLEPDNGVAWGVIGYTHACAGKMALAYAALVKAAALAPDNIGILSNVGLLSVWEQKSPGIDEVPAAAKESMSSNGGDWSTRESYTNGRTEAEAAYEARVGRIKRMKERAEKAQAAYEEVKARHKDLADRYEVLREQARTYEAEYNDSVAKIDEYKRKMALTGRDTDEATLNELYLRNLALRRKTAYNELNRVRREMAPLKRAYQKGRRVVERAKQEADRAKEAADFAERTVPKLTWKPPAVNGRVVTEGSVRPKAGPKTKPPATKPADQAAFKLRMAKMMMDNRHYEKAAAMLKEIVDQYPDSDEAVEAEKLLDKIKLLVSP